jgi:hypothetical protein
MRFLRSETQDRSPVWGNFGRRIWPTQALKFADRLNNLLANKVNAAQRMFTKRKPLFLRDLISTLKFQIGVTNCVTLSKSQSQKPERRTENSVRMLTKN